MFTPDNSASAIASKVSQVKSAIQLDMSNQEQPESGYSSAAVAGKSMQSAAVPTQVVGK